MTKEEFWGQVYVATLNQFLSRGNKYEYQYCCLRAKEAADHSVAHFIDFCNKTDEPVKEEELDIPF